MARINWQPRGKTKILSILGTRPDCIKLAPVLKILDQYPERCMSVVVSTWQHRKILSDVLRLFGINPHYSLNVMTKGQSLTEITTRVLRRIEAVLMLERPNIVLVQGDTTTSLAGGLAAFYQRIKIGHVEAGLRSFDQYQPYPEEMNRRLIAGMADYHFAPTERAKENLIHEGIPEKRICVTGNTGIDALQWALEKGKGDKDRNGGIGRLMGKVCERRLILVTAHRRENFGAKFEDICKALREIVRRNGDVIVVYPVHPNPNIERPARRLLSGCDRIEIVRPVGYGRFVRLLEKAYVILTDSGGIQEEAPSLGKPVLVLRDVTERAEAVEAGTARLVGTDPARIVSEVQRLLDDPGEYARRTRVNNPFGDGKAAEKIVEWMFNELG